MRIVPVMDLKGGIVVHGIAGRRDQYQPVRSVLADSCDPVVLANAFRSQLGLDELYLADLDAISGRPPSLELFHRMSSAGFTLWVDAGLQTAEEVPPLVGAGVSRIVAGLETLAGPDELERVCDTHSETVFSLDLREGRPLLGGSGWPSDVGEILALALGLGVQRILLLDLARVGVGTGTGTEALCRRLATSYPEVEISAGGGVRGIDDLRNLAADGVGAALVASALHDGRLTREVLAQGFHS
jgi:phosphoribosylformimino-5-aminoimidazole carboxamide ribotide isomerase